MAQKFLTNVELEAGLVDGSNSTGTSGYLLSSTGTATSWVDPAAVSVGESEQVHIACKNTSGVAISKGDPVYITGTVGTSFKIQIAKADASDSAKMPAVGLAETDLANNAEGFVIVSGVLKNLTTDPLSTSDGTPSSNDTVYVKEGGGLTRTKPTGSGNLIQNVGKVGRVNSANAGSLAVSTIMRTNDVPNLTTGKIWVGSPTYTTESTVVHLDETNGRMGIGTTSPLDRLHVDGARSNFNGIKIGENGNKIQFAGVDGNISVGNNDWLIFSEGATEFMRAGGSSGNVGIGTTSPSEKLHVSGNARVTGAYYDSNNSAGTSGQVLSSTGSATSWVSGSGLPGGPYLPLAGGTMTGDLLMDGKAGVGNVIGLATGTVSDAMSLKLYTYNNIDPGGGLGTSTGNMIQADLGSNLVLRQTANDGDITFQSDDGAGGIATYLTLDGSSTDAYFSNPGNVGIGTDIPSQKLHVIGNSEITGDIFLGRYILHNDDTNTWLGFPLDDTISFRTNGSDRMYINSSGNVGIGTTSPQKKLHVSSGDQSTARIRLSNTNTASGGDNIELVAGVHNVTQDGFSIYNASGGGTQFVIQGGGNVGIGINNPSSKLQVNGDLTVGDSSTVGSFINVIAAGSNQDAGIRFGSETNTDSKAAIYTNTVNSDLHFDVTETTRMLIDSGTGNVGIGTTSPSQKLSVSGDATFTGRIYTNTGGLASVGILGKAKTDGWAARYDSNNANFSGFYFDSGNDASLILRDDAGGANVYLQSDSTSYINGGNVGIGTINPSTTLEVVDTFSVQRTSNDNEGFYVTVSGTDANAIVETFYQEDSSSRYGIRKRYDGSTNLYQEFIHNNSTTGTEVYRVDRGTANTSIANGNVGIGTTDPSTKLDVVASTTGKTWADYAGTVGTFERNGDSNINIVSSNTGVGGVWFGDTGSMVRGRIRYEHASDKMELWTNNSEKVSITSAGYVGIGVTSPGAKLDIINAGGSAGTLADCQTYSALTIKPYSSVDSKLTFSANGISTQLIQATNNAGTNGRQISLQPFSGDVGIGVILPSEKLDVNGHIKAFNGYKGYVSDFNNGGFFHSPRSSDGANPLWIPINTTGMSSSDQYYNTWVPLYAGRVRKIILKHISGSTPVATVCTFRKKINGVLSGTTYAGTVTGGGAAGMKVTFDFGTNNFTFNAEDEVQIGVVTGVATQPIMGGMSYQIWYEYNIT